jgi:hypothetical protein
MITFLEIRFGIEIFGRVMEESKRIPLLDQLHQALCRQVILYFFYDDLFNGVGPLNKRLKIPEAQDHLISANPTQRYV